jgi:iron(III) transport system permease protein
VSRGTGRRATVAVVPAAALLVLLPLLAVSVGVLQAGTAPWQRVAGSGWVPLLGTTLALLALVLAGAVALGAGLAWLTTAYRFPGRRALQWLLVLPTAVPAYILGLVWSSLLSYPGPVQTTWRAVLGPEAPFPPVRTLPVAAAVLVLTLYPYVYLLARVAFRDQAATPYGAARTLGMRPLQAARRIVLPLARPSLAAGGLLVALEVLSDFATVQYFGVDTLSVGIFKVWRGQFDRPAATVLALLVLLLALALLAGERWLRRGARFSPSVRDTTPMAAVQLTGARGWAATAACSAVLLLAVVVPVVTLLLWSATAGVGDAAGFLTAAVSPSLTGAALSLGAPPRRVLTRVHLPLARSGLAVAAVLVAVDALKELPIVLLLRPFGFDTLAVRVWQLAEDSRYEMAGLPALAIVVVAMIPVVLLFRGDAESAPAADLPVLDTTGQPELAGVAR